MESTRVGNPGAGVCVSGKSEKEVEPQITQIDTDFEEVAQSISNPVW
jgi:hypothetical protein